MSSSVEMGYKRKAAKLLDEGFTYDADENLFVREGRGVTEIILLRYLWQDWQRISHRIIRRAD